MTAAPFDYQQEVAPHVLEKLLSLFLHAKSGTLATVLVLGASGALVTATVDNGMTTITITQPDPSAAESVGAPVASTTVANTTTTNTTVSQAILALFNRTTAEEDPTSTATGNGCSDAAHARNEQMKRVNDSSKTTRAEVKELGKDAPRTDAARELVSDADTAIKGIRQSAVKAIHATSPSAECDEDDDEDVDEQEGNNHDNDDEDDNDGDHEDEDEDEDEDDDNGTPPTTGAAPTTASTTPSVAFDGANAKAIADLAISAMNLWVTDLKVVLAAQPPATANTTSESETATSDNSKSNKNNHENKGKGGDEGELEDDD